MSVKDCWRVSPGCRISFDIRWKGICQAEITCNVPSTLDNRWSFSSKDDKKKVNHNQN